jgi:hypothetical protein
MKTKDFTTTILVDNTPAEAFKAITNPRGWWSEEIEGGTEKLNDEFTYHYKDVHNCRMKLIEVIPNEKVVWLVLDNYFSFTKDKTEWKGTKIIFEISEKDGKTQVRFTHQGLVPAYECYDICSNAWSEYATQSLRNLITKGKGNPNKKERIEKQDYTATIIVTATHQEAFNAINNIPGWWTEDMEGSLQKPDDIFTVRFGEVYITMKVTEFIPGKKIVWYVTDCNKPWLKNKKEWNGTELIWEISDKDNNTQILFTHKGLVPDIECYNACSDAWGEYLKQSLWSLITKGNGKPTKMKKAVKAN